ncbi:alpha/beta hydrolase [Kribbella sp. HUAS MG21]|uniref:Alpha/beta hydrolase n=1 Tax=Kribbella sp. HUAS MG21 TaxID=3160966 RepID=A0AAU7T319_9ACTN
MKQTTVNGIELAYSVEGEGAPVVFVHGAIWADFLRPLATQPALSGVRRIRYHRRGMGGSSGPAGSFADQVADAVALLDHLEVDSAHFVGHSEGAMIAMDVAAAHPERVRSLVLLEPLPAFGWLAASEHAGILEVFGPLMEAMAGRYQAGDVIGAYDALFTPQGVDWRTAANAAGPEVISQGIEDAPTWFEHEAQALPEWTFGPSQATAIHCPVLSWCAQPSAPLPVAIRAWLHGLFSQCEDTDLENGDHFSVATNPAAVADPIAAFVARQSVPTA